MKKKEKKRKLIIIFVLLFYVISNGKYLKITYKVTFLCELNDYSFYFSE